jgi:hypothetical protein
VAAELVTALRGLGLRAERSLSGDLDFLGKKRDTAQHLCLVIDDKVSRWQTTEAEWFLRRTLVAEDRRLFPVLTPATSSAALPGFLRNIRRVELGASNTPRDVARQLHAELTPPISKVDRGLVLVDTIGALDHARQLALGYDGWFFVEQIVRAMSVAVAKDDLEQLNKLARELDDARREAGTATGRYGAPGKLLEQVTQLIADLRWRAKRLS